MTTRNRTQHATVIMSMLAIFVFCGTLLDAFAQTSRGTVTGTVRDANAAVIPGATVTLTNVVTNVSRSTMTNGQGLYRFDAVDPGTYKLTFSAQGFATLANTDVVVSAN